MPLLQHDMIDGLPVDAIVDRDKDPPVFIKLVTVDGDIVAFKQQL